MTPDLSWKLGWCRAVWCSFSVVSQSWVGWWMWRWWRSVAVVVLAAEVGDLVLAQHPAQCVLELGELDEEVVFGVEVGATIGALWQQLAGEYPEMAIYERSISSAGANTYHYAAVAHTDCVAGSDCAIRQSNPGAWPYGWK